LTSNYDYKHAVVNTVSLICIQLLDPAYCCQRQKAKNVYA